MAFSLTDDTLRISGVVEESIVDGPGLRYVVFTQGCPHRCPGCHNPDTHDPRGGYDVSLGPLLQQVAENPLLAGVTLSGGEPFLQAGPLARLAREVRGLGKSVVVYTGYRYEQLRRMADEEGAIRDLLEATDLLVDGPYIEALRDLDLLYRGSANQRLLRLRDGLMEPQEAAG